LSWNREWVLLGDVVLALAFGERNERDLMLLDESLHRGDESLAHGIHEGRGGKRLPAMKPEERRDTTVGLEPGLIDIEVHPVDAFDLESDMILEDFGNRAW
jgi:hypothetical protein